MTMYIQCPTCSTSYEIPDENIKAGGRKVRCASCKTVWQTNAVALDVLKEPEVVASIIQVSDNIALPVSSTVLNNNQATALSDVFGEATNNLSDENSLLAQVEIKDTPVAEIPNEADTLDGAENRRINLKAELTTDDDWTSDSEAELDNSQDDIDALFDTPSAEEFGGPASPVAELDDLEQVKESKLAGLAVGASAIGAAVTGKLRNKTNMRRKLNNANGSKKKHKPGGFPIAASLATLLFLGLGAGVMYRDSVVASLPQTASLYKFIGLPVNLRGIVIQNVSSRIALEKGNTELTVEGEIINITQQTTKLSRLRFAIRSENGREIYSWKATVDKPSLEPGESLKFKRKLASPPEDGHDVIVRFETRNDMVAGVQ